MVSNHSLKIHDFRSRFLASVFRWYFVSSFNMENDQRIKARLLRWFPAILKKRMCFGLAFFASVFRSLTHQTRSIILPCATDSLRLLSRRAQPNGRATLFGWRDSAIKDFLDSWLLVLWPFVFMSVCVVVVCVFCWFADFVECGILRKCVQEFM